VSPRIDSSTTHLSPLAQWLERAILSALFLFVFFAPNSIAFTQAAWFLGLLFWIFRFAVWPRPALSRTPLDYALFGFFLLTALSSFVSYEPIVSIGKLRQASLFTIVYLFAENVRSTRLLRALVLVLIVGSVVNVLYMFGQYAFGRGVKVYGVSMNSPLTAAQLVSRRNSQSIPIKSGDTLEEVDGKKLKEPQQLVAALEDTSQKDPAKIKVYRVEWVAVLEVPRGRLLPGTSPDAQLGIDGWSAGRDRRATGFYDHWTTYAESLQLLASLVIGLFVALPQKQSRNGLLLGLAIAGMCGALLLSVTRASWLGLVASAVVIATIGLTRRALMLVAACALVLVVAGAFILQHKRNVGFFDQKDDSILWRETVQKEGLKLLVSSPRHLLVGVGMDSIKAHWREWGLFENGRIPMGHMHSDYLQIALERGVPALIVWLILMGMYAHLLWRTQRRVPEDDWIERGVTLGALGGLIGFMLSGFVHYNWGDSEVVMIFYLIMGLSLVVERQVRST
jgi:O-antigen ligase